MHKIKEEMLVTSLLVTATVKVASYLKLFFPKENPPKQLVTVEGGFFIVFIFFI